MYYNFDYILKMSLYEVKMGMLKYDPVSRKVTPNKLKGILKVTWVDDEKHLSWATDDKTGN